jgi:hypothetical protein
MKRKESREKDPLPMVHAETSAIQGSPFVESERRETLSASSSEPPIASRRRSLRSDKSSKSCTADEAEAMLRPKGSKKSKKSGATGKIGSVSDRSFEISNPGMATDIQSSNQPRRIRESGICNKTSSKSDGHRSSKAVGGSVAPGAKAEGANPSALGRRGRHSRNSSATVSDCCDHGDSSNQAFNQGSCVKQSTGISTKDVRWVLKFRAGSKGLRRPEVSVDLTDWKGDPDQFSEGTIFEAVQLLLYKAKIEAGDWTEDNISGLENQSVPQRHTDMEFTVEDWSQLFVLEYSSGKPQKASIFNEGKVQDTEAPSQARELEFDMNKKSIKVNIIVKLMMLCCK